jgi:hypothetical protein
VKGVGASCPAACTHTAPFTPTPPQRETFTALCSPPFRARGPLPPVPGHACRANFIAEATGRRGVDVGHDAKPLSWVLVEMYLVATAIWMVVDIVMHESTPAFRFLRYYPGQWGGIWGEHTS